MPVLDADKPKIVFHAAMMSIQNFGFFIMYFAIWLATPEAGVCAESRFAEGFMALTCFLVALAYLRLLCAWHGPSFCTTHHNIHRLLITAVLYQQRR